MIGLIRTRRARTGVGPAWLLAGLALAGPAAGAERGPASPPDRLAPPAPPGRGALDAAIASGLAFVGGAWKGDRFEDPYLEYVYPRERLVCPLPSCRVTYRLLDAYFDLRFLQEALGDLGPAAPAGDRALAVTRALVEPWGDSGPYNVERAPTPGGIALDTYCILGLLERDRPMAEIVAARLGARGWIPAGHYDVGEGFRALADETWCLRLLAATGTAPRRLPGAVAAALSRGRTEIEAAAGPEIAANLALHLLYMLRQPGAPPLPAEEAWIVARLEAAAAEPALAGDRLTLANLLEALAGDGCRPAGAPGRLASLLLSAQEPDGGWRSRRGEEGGTLRVFSTLRALLALARYRHACSPP